mgnify:FL=1
MYSNEYSAGIRESDKPMMKKNLCYIFIALMFATFSTALIAETGLSPDNTESVKKTWHGEWKMDTRIDWSRFNKIQLEKATVAFRKHWVRDQRNRTGNRPTKKDIERVKTELSEQLNVVFNQELTKNDTFIITDASGQDVMRITPKIVDLDIYAPDRMRDHIGYSFTDSQGNMTLELEIHDSQSDALLASVRQYTEDRRKGWFEWTTSVTNKRAAGFILTRWATDLRKWLVEAASRPEFREDPG